MINNDISIPMPAVAEWSPNIILVDADYVDRVAFDLIVNFERMIGRRIPQADLARWMDCIALDGGLRPGENHTQAVFIHSAERKSLSNFTPSDFDEQLDGKAFADNLGEFTLHSVKVEGPVSADDLYAECLETLLTSQQVERIMIVADMDTQFDRLRRIIEKAGSDHDVTLFAMAPLPGNRYFHSEILGYSLMSALGISSDELQTTP